MISDYDYKKYFIAITALYLHLEKICRPLLLPMIQPSLMKNSFTICTKAAANAPKKPLLDECNITSSTKKTTKYFLQNDKKPQIARGSIRSQKNNMSDCSNIFPQVNECLSAHFSMAK